MHNRRRRDDFVAEAWPLEKWPTPPEELIDAEELPVYKKRRQAVDLWANGALERDIRKETGYSARRARALFIRCARIDAITHAPVGFHACVPSFGRAYVARRRTAPFDFTRTQGGCGLSGALLELFTQHPTIERAMLTFIAERKVDGEVKAPILTPKKLHDHLLAECRRQGLRETDYPMNVKRKGYEAIRRWYTRNRYKHPVTAATNELGEARAQDIASAYTEAKSTVRRPLLQAYERVEMDEHFQNGAFTLQFPGEHGELRTIRTQRLWALAARDVRTSAILSTGVSYGPSFRREDVTRLLMRAVSPPKRYALRFANAEYRYDTQAAYPGELPEFTMQGWSELAFDSHPTHLSPATIAAITDTIGCSIAAERVGQQSSRRPIEQLFVYFADQASWLPSATGNNPKSPARRDPEREAALRHIDFTLSAELLDVLARNYNIKPNEACGGLSPLQMLQKLVLQGEVYGKRLDEHGPCQLWKLLPAFPARLNRIEKKGRLGPIYVELFGARYTSPSLANAQDLGPLRDAAVMLYVQEDARYAFAVQLDGNRFLGQLAVVGKFSTVPHNLEWRRAYVQFCRAEREAGKATGPHTMIGFIRGLAEVASSNDKAGAVLGGTVDFMNRYSTGHIEPIGTTPDEQANLISALDRIDVDDTETVEPQEEPAPKAPEPGPRRRRSTLL